MPAPTREELILNLKSNPKTKGMTDAQIAAKADEILPKLVEKYGGEATVKETIKAKIAEKGKPTASTAPKTTPLPTRSAPARPSPLPVVPSDTTAAPVPLAAPVAPKVAEKETVRVTTAPVRPSSDMPTGQVPYVGSGYYAPAAAPRPAPTPVMTDREIAEAAAEQGIRTWSPKSARDLMVPEPTPMLDKPTIPTSVTRYGGMGDFRREETAAAEVAGMRAAMKAMKPAKAALVDAMDDADVAAAYKRLNAE